MYLKMGIKSIEKIEFDFENFLELIKKLKCE